jgi:4a-hydroxytetrahydrobiopterin dehydratase
MARLTDEEIEERRAGLEGWERSGDAIVKSFDNGDFKGSVEFVNRLTPEAEEMNHHPDLEISWKTVTVTITTHSEGGLLGVDDREDLRHLLAERDVQRRGDQVGDAERDRQRGAVGDRRAEGVLEQPRDRRLAQEADAERGHRDAELTSRQVLVDALDLP